MFGWLNPLSWYRYFTSYWYPNQTTPNTASVSEAPKIKIQVTSAEAIEKGQEKADATAAELEPQLDGLINRAGIVPPAENTKTREQTPVANLYQNPEQQPKNKNKGPLHKARKMVKKAFPGASVLLDDPLGTEQQGQLKQKLENAGRAFGDTGKSLESASQKVKKARQNNAAQQSKFVGKITKTVANSHKV